MRQRTGTLTMQLDQHVLHFAPPQGQRRVTDAHDEGITAGACFGQHLDVLAVDESELEQSPLERREWSGRARADTDHAAPRARWEGRQADVARIESQTAWCRNRVHICQYG